MTTRLKQAKRPFQSSNMNTSIINLFSIFIAGIIFGGCSKAPEPGKISARVVDESVQTYNKETEFHPKVSDNVSEFIDTEDTDISEAKTCRDMASRGPRWASQAGSLLSYAGQGKCTCGPKQANGLVICKSRLYASRGTTDATGIIKNFDGTPFHPIVE